MSKINTLKNILLTGASRGLGRAMLAEFVAAGHTIHGCARSQAGVDLLRQEFPTPHTFAVVDVADDDAVGAWASQLLESHGPPDLLVNNAALINKSRPLWLTPPEEFSDVIDVNIKGVFHTIRHFVPAMIERGSGVIVNFSSGWGRSVSPDVAPYCATKFAIEGMTLALAAELPDGMAAIPLNPGIIHTDMLDSCFGADAASFPTPAKWATQAAPFILNLGPRDNGRSLTAPG